MKSIDIENSLPDQSEYHFVMLSPLVVSVPEENNGKLYHRYLHPEEEEFYEVFRKNLVKKYRAFYGKEPEGTVEVIPDWDYIKSRQRITKRIKLKNAFVRAVVFPFKIRGEKKLVEIGYEAGFGEKNSMGFGMVALKNMRGEKMGEVVKLVTFLGLGKYEESEIKINGNLLDGCVKMMAPRIFFVFDNRFPTSIN